MPRKHWDRQGGRVTKGDVLERIASFSKETCAEPLEERVPMTRLRQKIAERLKGAQNTAAILTTFNESIWDRDGDTGKV